MLGLYLVYLVLFVSKGLISYGGELVIFLLEKVQIGVYLKRIFRLKNLQSGAYLKRKCVCACTAQVVGKHVMLTPGGVGRSSSGKGTLCS